MFATKFPVCPVILTASRKVEASNSINNEDLLGKVKKKTHQKTYRNRDRGNASTSPLTPCPTRKAIRHNSQRPTSPAPAATTADADQRKIYDNVKQSRKRKARRELDHDVDQSISVKDTALKRRNLEGAPHKGHTPVKDVERFVLSPKVRPILSSLHPQDTG